MIERIAELMKHDTAGDPMTGLKWTRKTPAKVAAELRKAGIEVGAKTVVRLLKKMVPRQTTVVPSVEGHVYWSTPVVDVDSSSNSLRIRRSSFVFLLLRKSWLFLNAFGSSSANAVGGFSIEPQSILT